MSRRPPYRMSRDAYLDAEVGPRPPECESSTDPGFERVCEPWLKRERVARNTWERSVLGAVSEGQVIPNVASVHRSLYRISESDWRKLRPLPADLYAVTTARTRVLAHGLTSEFDDPAAHKALGRRGGEEDTILVTDDPQVAAGERDAVVEARAVLRGEIQPHQLLADAKAGRGAGAPYFRTLMRRYNSKWTSKRPLPAQVQDALEGFVPVPEYTSMAWLTRPLTVAAAARRGWVCRSTWRPKKGPLQCGDPVREATPKERRKQLLGFIDKVQEARAEQGGARGFDFWRADPERLAALPLHEIAVVKAQPCPNAHGVKQPWLGQWTTWSSKALRIETIDGKKVGNRAVTKCRTGVYRGPRPVKTRHLWYATSIYRHINEPALEPWRRDTPPREYFEPLLLYGDPDDAWWSARTKHRYAREDNTVLYRLRVSERDLVRPDEAGYEVAPSILQRLMRHPEAPAMCWGLLDEEAVDTPRELSLDGQQDCYRLLEQDGVVPDPEKTRTWQDALGVSGVVGLWGAVAWEDVKRIYEPSVILRSPNHRREARESERAEEKMRREQSAEVQERRQRKEARIHASARVRTGWRLDGD